MLSRVTRVRKISMHGIILTLQSRSVQIIAEHLNVTNIRSKERLGYQNKDTIGIPVRIVVRFAYIIFSYLKTGVSSSAMNLTKRIQFYDIGNNNARNADRETA
jgi:hypothetical protein